jgi:hypothetical protein
MKNVFYYADNAVTRKICETYGDRLQELDYAARYELIGYLGLWLYAVETADHDEEVHWKELLDDDEPDGDVHHILNLCDQLDPQAVLNFIAAIASQGAQ